jgi:ABC-2 type transport system permease protein
VAALSGRAVRRLSRQPALWGPAVAFPLLFSAILTSALSSAEQLPGFAASSSYLAFTVPPALVQATLLAAVACGLEHSEDIETGFNDRVLLAPAHRLTNSVSHVLCASALSVVLVGVLLLAFWLFGIRAPGGLETYAAVVGIYALLGAGSSGLTVALAGWTGSVQTVLGAYPLVLLLTFFSTALVPAEVMAPWFGTIASRNPLSWFLADVRDLVNGPWSPSAFFAAAALAGVLCIGSAALLVPASRRRVVA